MKSFIAIYMIFSFGLMSASNASDPKVTCNLQHFKNGSLSSDKNLKFDSSRSPLSATIAGFRTNISLAQDCDNDGNKCSEVQLRVRISGKLGADEVLVRSQVPSFFSLPSASRSKTELKIRNETLYVSCGLEFRANEFP